MEATPATAVAIPNERRRLQRLGVFGFCERLGTLHATWSGEELRQLKLRAGALRWPIGSLECLEALLDLPALRGLELLELDVHQGGAAPLSPVVERELVQRHLAVLDRRAAPFHIRLRTCFGFDPGTFEFSSRSRVELAPSEPVALVLKERLSLEPGSCALSLSSPVELGELALFPAEAGVSNVQLHTVGSRTSVRATAGGSPFSTFGLVPHNGLACSGDAWLSLQPGDSLGLVDAAGKVFRIEVVPVRRDDVPARFRLQPASSAIAAWPGRRALEWPRVQLLPTSRSGPVSEELVLPLTETSAPGLLAARWAPRGVFSAEDCQVLVRRSANGFVTQGGAPLSHLSAHRTASGTWYRFFETACAPWTGAFDWPPLLGDLDRTRSALMTALGDGPLAHLLNRARDGAENSREPWLCLLAPAGELWLRGLLQLEHRGGLVRRARVRPPPGATRLELPVLLPPLLRSPAFRYLSALEVNLGFTASDLELASALLAAHLPHLERVTVHCATKSEDREALASMSELLRPTRLEFGEAAPVRLGELRGAWDLLPTRAGVAVVGPLPFVAREGRLEASAERHHHLLTANAVIPSSASPQRVAVNGLWLDEEWENGREFPVYEGDEVRVTGEGVDVTALVRRA